MHYVLSPNIALRKWKYVDRAIYIKGHEDPLPVLKEDFAVLCQCDGKHELENSPIIEKLLHRGWIQEGTELN